MTSTRRTIPAPPPKGVSSTWPPLSGVWSRGLSAAQLVAVRERRWHVALVAEPVEPLGEQRDDVELHQARRRQSSPSRNPRSTSMTPRGDVDRADRVADERHEQSLPARRARPRAARTRAAQAAPDDADARRSPSTTRSPRGPRRTTRPPRARGACARGTSRSLAAQRLGRRRGRRRPSRRRIGRSSVPARRTISRSAPADAQRHAQRQQRGARPRDAEGAVEAVRPADAAGGEPARPRVGGSRQSTMSTSTRRFSLTAAALTTVRSALAVRPPRPMILP